MRNDLQQEIRLLKRSLDMRQVRLAMLVSHRGCRNPKRSVIKGANERVDLGPQDRVCELFRESPEFASASDRSLVVKKHAMTVAALAAAEGNRNHLASLRVVAKARRIRHAHEFVFNQRLVFVEFERLRYHRP